MILDFIKLKRKGNVRMITEMISFKNRPLQLGESLQRCTCFSRSPLAPKPHLISFYFRRRGKITATLTRSGKPTTIQVKKIFVAGDQKFILSSNNIEDIMGY